VHIHRLDISGIRNIDKARLDGLGQVNVFYGANGSGKTSILESLHMLCLGRSFRSRQFRSVIQDGKEASTVFTSVTDLSNGKKTSAGVSRSRSSSPEIRINGESINTLAVLAQLFPLQLLSADSFELIEGGPAIRRQFLDWGVFHVEHSFISHWQAVKKCIKHRNSLLRHGKIHDSSLEAWDHELAEKGALIDKARAGYIERFQPVFAETVERVAGLKGLSLEYYKGWSRDDDLASALAGARDKDVQQGYTSVGPHRADLRIRAQGRPASEVLSRGQEKILVCALRLAQASVLRGTSGKECIFLIDDLPSELDASYRASLCVELERLNAQAFITCIEPREIESLWSKEVNVRMFHVEHGDISISES